MSAAPGPRASMRPAPTAGPEQHGAVPADRVEPDRAGQVLGADDVVDDELDRRRADHPRHAVEHEERDGVPRAQRPVRKRAPQASETNIGQTWETWISRRQSYRSASAPV